MNPILDVDFYKFGHREQYPKGITQVWSNWTPRKSRVPGVESVVNFGQQFFVEHVLQDQWNKHFFEVPVEFVVDQYVELIQKTLRVKNPPVDHIRELHGLGYLPIKLYALPEGSTVPIGVPTHVITNTKPEFFWLPNYLETTMSNYLWKPITSATTAREFRKLFIRYAKAAGETDLSFVDWMGHDFSYRGMSGREDAILSGLGHLVFFSGTDSVPAIVAANEFYGADYSVGGSVFATEHSVMSAGGKADEFETFKRLVTEVYPEGIVSIVSDTWDLWKVLTEIVPRLKDTILGRNGKVVIRPDSGDPVKILIGDDDKGFTRHQYNTIKHPAFYGTLELLKNAVGSTQRDGALPLLNNMGMIYGDSITLERAEAILEGIVHKHKMSPYNCVFGIGSYTYEYVTRDTFGQAMKATGVRMGDEVIPIWKNPVTDDGMKKSLRGIPAVYDDTMYGDVPKYYVIDNATERQLDKCAYEVIFKNGWSKTVTFDQIREEARQWTDL